MKLDKLITFFFVGILTSLVAFTSQSDDSLQVLREFKAIVLIPTAFVDTYLPANTPKQMYLRFQINQYFSSAMEEKP